MTEAETVPKVLSWAIREMERRYTLLSGAGAKDVDPYNKKVRAGDITGNDEGVPPRKLPYIVIIVDELAEPMMVAAKDIEISIARLAQMARIRNSPDSGYAASFGGRLLPALLRLIFRPECPSKFQPSRIPHNS